MKGIFLLISFVVLLLISGCGYKFTVKKELPTGINKVFVETFRNETHEVGLESLFTNKFIEQMVQYLPLGTISKYKNINTNIIQGEIKSLHTNNIFHDENQSYTLNTTRQRIVGTAELRLVNQKGEIIRSTCEITESQDYDFTPDSCTNHSRRQEAIYKLIEKLSRSAFRRLTENF